MRHLEREDLQEIARFVGISPWDVRARILRAPFWISEELTTKA
jgi:hypothetical protein